MTRIEGAAGMAELIDAYDWEGSPIGPRSSWPPALRLTVDIALASGFPMLVFWSPDLTQIYNDAFVPILGARHPAALGQFAKDCWPEIWDTIGPLLHGVRETESPYGRKTCRSRSNATASQSRRTSRFHTAGF